MCNRVLLLVLMFTISALAGCGSDEDTRSASSRDSTDTKPAADAEADEPAPAPAQLTYIEEFGSAFADELTEPGSAERETFLECFRTQAKGMPSVPKAEWPKLANDLSTPCRQELSDGHGGPIE